jgi:hypothetical protein
MGRCVSNAAGSKKSAGESHRRKFVPFESPSQGRIFGGRRHGERTRADDGRRGSPTIGAIGVKMKEDGAVERGTISKPHNDLAEGAGETHPLIRNDFFDRYPHLRCDQRRHSFTAAARRLIRPARPLSKLSSKRPAIPLELDSTQPGWNPAYQPALRTTKHVR